MIEARLHFIFFKDKIGDLYTKWVQVDELSFEKIDDIIGSDYRYFLAEATAALGLNESYMEDLISQIYEGKGRVTIEIAPIEYSIG